jgi:hypothetical protein
MRSAQALCRVSANCGFCICVLMLLYVSPHTTECILQVYPYTKTKKRLLTCLDFLFVFIFFFYRSALKNTILILEEELESLDEKEYYQQARA